MFIRKIWQTTVRAEELYLLEWQKRRRSWPPPVGRLSPFILLLRVEEEKFEQQVRKDGQTIHLLRKSKKQHNF